MTSACPTRVPALETPAVPSVGSLCSGGGREGPRGETTFLLRDVGRSAGPDTPAPRRLLLSLSPQPGPLVLRPGPVHAVDGDQGISQRILYSIVRGECGPHPFPSVSCTPPWAAGLWGTWAEPVGPSPSAAGGGRRPSFPTTLAGQEDGTFAIGADSGNLTMTRSVPSPKTFTLVVKVGALARPPRPS